MAANLREFNGCEYVIQVTGTEKEQGDKLLAVVARLMDCHHPHNFCVARDGGRVYISKNAVECLQFQNVLPHRLDLDSLLGGL